MFATLEVAESEVELGEIPHRAWGWAPVRYGISHNAILKQVNEGGLILLVEDDENDVALVQRAFAKAGARAAMRVVKSAEEAMAYLKNEPPYSDREENPTPGLVLLDLKLPGLDGFELLRWIRSQAELEKLRVCVVTSSPLYRDLCHAHELGANSFLTKPLEHANVDALVAAMNGPMRWLGELPFGVRRDASG